jgi:hypothetical protein
VGLIVEGVGVIEDGGPQAIGIKNKGIREVKLNK